MSRTLKLIALGAVAIAVVGLASACGSQNIRVPTSQTQLHYGATLFNQRCAGCHSLQYAAAHGSAANVRTAQYNNGPNFNIRCERPIARVLYAIENGGFSGAIMPQNVVVGSDALAVARFVATYAGRQAPHIPGAVICQNEPIGTIPTAAQIAALSKHGVAAGTPRTGATQVAAAAGTPAVGGGPSQAGGATKSHKTSAAKKQKTKP